MSRYEDSFNKIYKMHEDDFSKSVIIPLFKKMGFNSVEFHGGPHEKGKDVIAKYLDKFGIDEVSVIQTKMLKTSGKISDGAKLNKIIHQLKQCINKSIQFIDGTERVVKDVLFITPYQIDTRVLADQFEELGAPNIMVVDKTILVKWIDRSWPEFNREFLGDVDTALKINSDELKNVELEKALQITSNTQYSSYYSDLGFFVGTMESGTVFSSEIVATKLYDGHMVEDEWSQINSISRRLKDICNVSLIIGDVAEIESKYMTWKSKFEAEENRLLIKKLDEATRCVDQITNSIDDKMREALAFLEEACNSKIVEKSKDKTYLECAKSSIKTLDLLLPPFHYGNCSAQVNEVVSVISSYPELQKASSVLDSILSQLSELDSVKRKQNLLSQKIIDEPKYFATISIDDARKGINDYLMRVSDELIKLNSDDLSSSEIFRILENINSALRLAEFLVNEINSKSVKFELKKVKEFDKKLNVSISKIFDSGANVALFGEAGAGKSTTLHVYAEKRHKNKRPDEVVIFIPLNRLVSSLNFMAAEHSGSDGVAPNHLKRFLSAYLQYKGVSGTDESISAFEETLKRSSRGLAVIDALDEAASHAAWVIPALSEFASQYPNFQILTSSRDCVRFVKDIKFLGVTLLPFSKDQLMRFVFGWMKSNKEAEELWSSIVKLDLFEIAKNPLLATIICSLREKGVPLPENEPDVYRKKIDLLCGIYDHFKGISRTKSDRDFLKKCCNVVAFHLHSRRLREASLRDIEDYLLTDLRGRVPAELVRNAIDDLVFECNILIKVLDGDKYSFGHLRFQEFLASERLISDRSIDINSLLDDPWWHGVLYMTAFSIDIEQILNDTFLGKNKLVDCLKILKKMISAQPRTKQAGQMDLLKRNYIQEKGESFIFNDHKIDTRFNFERTGWERFSR